MTVLDTERLVLRPFELADAPAVQQLCSAREIAENTLTIPHPYTLEDARAFVSSTGSFAVTLADGTLVGTIALDLEPPHRRAQLGNWIGVPYWGNGYATEAGRSVLDHGFGELGLNRIYAYCFTRNPASARVLQKLGMTPEGTRRRHALKWGEYLDEEVFGILASER